jgi:DNA-binding NarL/FixJ family response regulator
VIVKIAIAPVIAAFQVDSIKILFLGLGFECMAIGALGAYLYCESRILNRRTRQGSVYAWGQFTSSVALLVSQSVRLRLSPGVVYFVQLTSNCVREGDRRAMAKKIKVMIVDDHPVFRQGLRNVLASHEDLDIIGEAADGEEAVERAQALLPDVVVMDINLPSMNGLQATRELKAHCPEINVIMLTAYDDEEQVYHAVRAGASSFHAKDVSPERLVDVIRHVSQGCYVLGGRVLDEGGIGDWLLEEFRRFGGGSGLDEELSFLAPLSPREMEILGLVIQGMSNKEIAYHLGISHQTVKNHMTAILGKLGVADRTQAAVYALRHGWVPLRDQKNLSR